MPEPLRFTVSPALSYAVNWLRETAPGQFCHDFAVPIEVSAHAGVPLEEAAIRLADALLRLAPPDEHDRARPVLGELATRIIRRTATALERHCSAELSALGGAPNSETRLELHLPFLDRRQWQRRWEALARVEVEATEDGRLLAYTVEPKDHRARQCAYQSTLALCGALLASAAGEPPPAVTLSFNDRRTLPRWPENLGALLRAYGFEGQVSEWLAAHPAAADGGLEVSLTLSVPGDLVCAWLQAPNNRDPDFFSTYAAVSVAVQRALRRWAPYVYFSDPNRYDDLLAAWPMLVYQAMPPFPGRPKYEFTYDIVDLGATLLMRRATLRELTATFARLRPYLIALGKHKTARFYDPDDAPNILTGVARQPRMLNTLLAADAFFVEALLNLGLRGHAFRQAVAGNPGQAVKELARFAGDFVTRLQRRLRRLYAGRDFLALGPLLLIEATRALRAARRQPAPSSAILRLTAGAVEQTFVSAAYRL